MADFSKIEQLKAMQLLGKTTPEQDNELEALARESEENRHLIETLLSPEAFYRRREIVRGYDPKRLHRRIRRKLSGTRGFEAWPADTRPRRRIIGWSIAASLLLAAGMAGWLANQPPKLPPTFNDSGLVPVISASLRWKPPVVDNQAGSTGEAPIGLLPERKAYPAGEAHVARMGNQFYLYPIDHQTSTPLIYTFITDGADTIEVFYDSVHAQVFPHSSFSFQWPIPQTAAAMDSVAYTGEILLDVSHNPHNPFIVTNGSRSVDVLGTRFRVRDFPKAEDTSSVFCYTGKVRIRDPDGKTQILLAAQRATTDRRRGGWLVSTGDFPDINWSSPERPFDFTDLNLDSAMTEVAGWYAISNVIFEKGIDHKTRGIVFKGTISRYLNLEQMLAFLERPDLHFSVRGNIIFVNKKK